MAKQGLSVLDSDLHLMEPPDMYARHLAEKYRHRAPQANRQLPGHFAWWRLRDAVYPLGRKTTPCWKRTNAWTLAPGT